MFLVFGEKCQELQVSGNDAFFHFSGHVDLFVFQVFDGKWAETKEPVINEFCNAFRNRSEFVETCFHQANLLMHRPADFKVLPPQSQQK